MFLLLRSDARGHFRRTCGTMGEPGEGMEGMEGPGFHPWLLTLGRSEVMKI